MQRLILQFGFVLSLLFIATSSLRAQIEFEPNPAATIVKVLNPRVCLDKTETVTDKCPANELERSCPAGNCDWNYLACRIYNATPNREYEYDVSEVADHEIENPKANPNGVAAEEEGSAKVCYKRKSCFCDRIPGVQATCKTDPIVTEVVIKKWKKLDVVCVNIKKSEIED
jgi:hypothetical protein